MVRKHILTDLEQAFLLAYLKDGTQLPGFRTLKHYIQNLDIERLETDLRLIKELLARARTSAR